MRTSFRSRFIIVLLGAIGVCIPLTALRCATLTSISDRLTHDQASAASDHEIRFTSPTGVDAPTDTVTLTFGSGFSLATITVADVALSNGPATGLETVKTLAAASGINIWGVSVSGQLITFSAPTNAALGEIPAGDKIVIRIGTNAGGTNQVTNPSAPDTYFTSLGGTFGDRGSLYIPIQSADSSVSVSATFGGTPTPPGGGSGSGLPEPPGGTTTTPPTTTSTPALPPVISNIDVTSTLDTTAVVTWQTDHAASSMVAYGTTSAYGATTTNPALATVHSITLSGLTPGTLYHFRVGSTDAGARTAFSGDDSFVTLPSMAIPTNVSDFSASSSRRQIYLSWINPTDLDFSRVMIVARTDRYPTGVSDGRRVYEGTDTRVTDAGLADDTAYYYTCFAVNAGGNISSGALAHATTLSAIVPPVVPPTPPTPPVVPPTLPAVPPSGGAVTPPVTPGGPSAGGGVATTTQPQPPVIVPPIVPPPAGATTTFSLLPRFFAANGHVSLTPSAGNHLSITTDQPIMVRIPVSDLPSAAINGSVNVGASTYALTLTPDREAWAASFVPSRLVASVPIHVAIDLANGMFASSDYQADVRSYGHIFETIMVQGTPKSGALAGADVSLFVKQGGSYVLWDGATFSQTNPVRTGSDGTYAFLTPNGDYQIRVHKDDYHDVAKEVIVTQNVASVDVEMTRVQANAAQAVENAVPILGQIETAATTINTQIQAALDQVRTPEVKAVSQNFVVPATTLVVLSSMATAGAAFNLLNYLRFLITQPILLLYRRKRQKWGVVYNSLTKQPIDLAIVRLLNAETGRVIQTRITDAKGRYAFIVKPGRYLLEAVKPGYAYPSPIMKDSKEDLDFVDLYHGELVEVTQGTTITPNIPIDPEVKAETPKQVLFKRALRRTQNVGSFVSVVFTIGASILFPSWYMTGLLAFQVACYFIFRRLAIPKKPKGWGIVYDAKERKTLDRVIVRIFDKKFNKLLETQITDNNGKYGFFAGHSVYYVTAEKLGYAKFVSPDLDLKQKKQTFVDQPVPLLRAG